MSATFPLSRIVASSIVNHRQSAVRRQAPRMARL